MESSDHMTHDTCPEMCLEVCKLYHWKKNEFTLHYKIFQLVKLGQESLDVLSPRSCFLIGNGKCKQLSDWSELELSTANRVIPTSAL